MVHSLGTSIETEVWPPTLRSTDLHQMLDVQVCAALWQQEQCIANHLPCCLVTRIANHLPCCLVSRFLYVACACACAYACAYAYAYAYAGDVQEVENREEVEAAEAAQDNADREAFEHT